MRALRLLLDLEPHPDQAFLSLGQLGLHGYTITVSPSHIDYLHSLNLSLEPDPPAFDSDAIDRWRLVNQLLLAGFDARSSEERLLFSQYPALAALAAFPTLEEIARRISSRWDEEGKLLHAVSAADGMVTRKPDGTLEPKLYKVGNRIVPLSHKLQLLESALHPELQRIISELDKVLQRPMVDGMNQSMSPLYERLQHFRDQWVHGRRFDGWEALLISLYLALVYFGSRRFRPTQVDSSTIHAA